MEAFSTVDINQDAVVVNCQLGKGRSTIALCICVLLWNKEPTMIARNRSSASVYTDMESDNYHLEKVIFHLCNCVFNVSLEGRV